MTSSAVVTAPYHAHLLMPAADPPRITIMAAAGRHMRLHIDRQAQIDRVRRLELPLELDCVTRPSYESSTLRERS
jgi:hypothetical protein